MPNSRNAAARPSHNRVPHDERQATGHQRSDPGRLQSLRLDAGQAHAGRQRRAAVLQPGHRFRAGAPVQHRRRRRCRVAVGQLPQSVLRDLQPGKALADAASHRAIDGRDHPGRGEQRRGRQPRPVHAGGLPGAAGAGRLHAARLLARHARERRGSHLPDADPPFHHAGPDPAPDHGRRRQRARSWRVPCNGSKAWPRRPEPVPALRAPRPGVSPPHCIRSPAGRTAAICCGRCRSRPYRRTLRRARPRSSPGCAPRPAHPWG